MILLFSSCHIEFMESSKMSKYSLRLMVRFGWRLIKTSYVCRWKSACVCVGVCVIYVCASCLLVPGETDVLLLTALLSVWPLWRTAIQQTCAAWTIQLALRQSLKDPIVSALSNYGNLINLFCSSPLTAFVSAWDLLRDLCELRPIEGARDEGSALFRRKLASL